MQGARRSALARVHVAVACFGLAGVLGKLAPLPALLIVLGRVLFAGLCLAGLVAIRNIDARWRTQADLGALIASGCLLALHWTAFFQSVQVANVAVALLSFSTFPLFTVILEPLLVRARPHALEVVAALLILLGVALLVPSIDLNNAITRGVAWGVFAGFSFAVLSIWNRQLTRRYPGIVISLYQDAAAAAVLLPALLLLRPSLTAIASSLAVLLILGVVCTALAHTLFIEGMRTIPARSASVIAALEPVWGILFALVLLDEIPSTRSLIGGVLIVGATILPQLRGGSNMRHSEHAGR